MKLVNWQKRRNDPRVENYWKNKNELNSFEEFQKKWNFIEFEYGDRSSNNDLDLMNPGFAYTTNLAKYLK